MTNTNNFFNMVAEDLQLGKVIEKPVQENGEVIFRFPRFFFIATK